MQTIHSNPRRLYIPVLTPILRGLFWCLMKATGGRPMKRKGYAFRDSVSNKDVYYYEDYFGRTYMAERGLSLYRSGYNATAD